VTHAAPTSLRPSPEGGGWAPTHMQPGRHPADPRQLRGGRRWADERQHQGLEAAVEGAMQRQLPPGVRQPPPSQVPGDRRPSAQARRARGCRCLRWLRETCLKKQMSQ